MNDSEGVDPHQQVRDISWTKTEKKCGKRIHLKNFPKGHQVKLFRIVSDTRRTENKKNKENKKNTHYIVTNDLSQSNAKATEKECQVRWKIELLHREIKQTTGIDKCQCRKVRAQRNHIACSFQVWVCLKRVARSLGNTIYNLKESLLGDYLRHQLSNPSIIFKIA